VLPFDQLTVPPQPVAVNVTLVPAQIAVLGHEITGALGTPTVTVAGAEVLGFPQPLTLH